MDDMAPNIPLKNHANSPPHAWEKQQDSDCEEKTVTKSRFKAESQE